MADVTEYHDGIAPLVERENVQRCPTCHEPRPDFSMPCDWCCEID